MRNTKCGMWSEDRGSPAAHHASAITYHAPLASSSPMAPNMQPIGVLSRR